MVYQYCDTVLCTIAAEFSCQSLVPGWRRTATRIFSKGPSLLMSILLFSERVNCRAQISALLHSLKKINIKLLILYQKILYDSKYIYLLLLGAETNYATYVRLQMQLKNYHGSFCHHQSLIRYSCAELSYVMLRKKWLVYIIYLHDYSIFSWILEFPKRRNKKSLPTVPPPVLLRPTFFMTIVWSLSFSWNK